MRNFLLSFGCLMLLSVAATRSDAQSTGVFTQTTDVGNPKIKGSTKYGADTQSYIMTGSGTNIWAKADEFHFAAVQMSGDFILTVNCKFEGKGMNAHRKIGLMIRENLNGGARYADAAIHGDGLTSLQYRPKENEETLEIKATLTAPDIIQLEKKGDTIIMRAAKTGVPFVETGRMVIPFAQQVYAGLFLCSHDATVIETAKFHNFRIDVPAAANVDGYRQPAASRLEIMDIETGVRKVIYTTKGHIEAPNWFLNGKYLIYNSGGLLYRFPLNTKTPEVINTGNVKSCNNDHGLSFDGKMIAISSSTKLPGGKSGSMVYTVPVKGGTPVAITKDVPSYWHGWSPDGKTLVFCAERNGDYNVFGISSKGGDEFQLTTANGLDDGPEYAPDGKHIYFNSVRSGMMKIWRMSPDGSNQEQVSFGDYNDWFAHISPDGKKMVYVSYPAYVPANSHPNNQRVMIHLQSTAGQEQKVLAYIYGGQGTMNVPSWSPDGKKIAFVSFTYGDPNY